VRSNDRFAAVNLFQVRFDIARAHAARMALKRHCFAPIHTQNLVVKTRPARLIFRHNQRLKRRVAVARRLQLQLAKVAFQRLTGLAVARISALVTGWIVVSGLPVGDCFAIVLGVPQVVAQLGIQRPLQNRFGELLQPAVLARYILRPLPVLGQ
jgi:hypothetical protein